MPGSPSVSGKDCQVVLLVKVLAIESLLMFDLLAIQSLLTFDKFKIYINE